MPVFDAIKEDKVGSFVFLCAIIFYMVLSMCLFALAKYIVYCISSGIKKDNDLAGSSKRAESKG